MCATLSFALFQTSSPIAYLSLRKLVLCFVYDLRSQLIHILDGRSLEVVGSALAAEGAWTEGAWMSLTQRLLLTETFRLRFSSAGLILKNIKKGWQAVS